MLNHRSCFGIMLLGIISLWMQGPPPAIAADPSDARQAQPNVSPYQSSNATALYSLEEVYKDQLRRLGETTSEQLNALHQQNYAATLGFTVNLAQYYEQFVKAFGLSNQAKEKLETLGFVVLPPSKGKNWEGPSGPTDLYYRVYAADLPVFISADSIMHAWHQSYDNMLRQVEQYTLAEKLKDILERTLASLGAKTQAQRDAYWYLHVAREILARSEEDQEYSSEDPDQPPPKKKKTTLELRLIESYRPASITCFGEKRSVDFSLFKPRGHYSKSRLLESYFQALMWLSQASCAMTLYDPKTNLMPKPRQEAAARALIGAMERSGTLSQWNKLSAFYDAVVGKTGRLSPDALLSACTRRNLQGCQGESTEISELYQELASSHQPNYLSSHSDEPLILSLFSQRFAYDAWAHSLTISDTRLMVTAEELGFVLGSDRALQYITEEMNQDSDLPRRLEAVRRTLEIVHPTDLDETVYNFTLEALMEMAKTRLDPRLPSVFNTAIWQDRKLEATLAGWAEARHDNILIIEPSEGGGCVYPLGYVDPLPEFYRALGKAAQRLANALSPLIPADETEHWAGVLKHWPATMERLAQIAEVELLGTPLEKEQLDFLKNTVDMHLTQGYGLERTYSGWYPQLYFAENGVNSEPVIADVHTNKQTGMTLEVGSGHMGLIIVAVNSGTDIALYGGPAYSFYEFQVPMSKRMTDQQFVQRLSTNVLPKPAFTQSYWVLDHKTRTPPDKASSKMKLRKRTGEKAR